jgi:hypothetical protein
MRLLEFYSDPTLAPPAVLNALRSHLGGRITRIGGKNRVYTVGNQTGVIYVFEGTLKAFGMSWVKSPSGPKVKSFYVWNHLDLNRLPDYELDIPEGISFPEVLDQVVHWLKFPSVGKELTEEMLDEARRSSDEEFMAMARRDMPDTVHSLSLTDMMKIAKDNDVQIPSSIRGNPNLKVDAHHWNLSGKSISSTPGFDMTGAANELGGEFDDQLPVDDDPMAQDLRALDKIKTVKKMTYSGKLWLMGRNPRTNKFFRFPESVEDMLEQLSRMHSRHIESLGGGDNRDGMEEQYDMLKEKVRLVAGGESAFIKSLLITGAPSSGKALALNTPIPTPSGWTTMGEVKIGDTLFDENGHPCQVTFATPVQLNRKCFEMTFDDGTKIVADAEHRWLTNTQASRQSEKRSQKRWFEGALPLQPNGSDQSNKRIFPKIVNTEEISKTLYSTGKLNHRIDVAKPFVGHEKDLPVSPYILGVWLGDGTSSGATVSCGNDDLKQMLTLLEYENQDYKIAPDSRKKNWIIRLSKGRGGKNNEKVISKLRLLNLINNKHIPNSYLRASEKQRFSLLQGLMDTDGCINDGRCEFTSTNKQLAEDVFDLVKGLGIKATFGIGRSTINGIDKGEKYRIGFTTSLSVFRFDRKIARIKDEFKRDVTSRTIVECKEIDSVPVRCITVDSTSHLFLCSRSYVPTHNTFVVMQTIRELGLKAGRDYVVKKGYITTNSMYRTLIERVNGLVIFDDCDSVVEEKAAVNMLKGALDTDPVREISYDVRGGINTATMDDEDREILVDAMSRILRNVPEEGDIEMFDRYLKKKKKKSKPSSDEDMEDEDYDEEDGDSDEEKIHEIQKYITMHLPNKIDFKGRIIFISNMDEAEWDSAILTRAFTINMNFSSGEMLDYIDKIKSHIPAALNDEQKQEVVDWIRELYTMGKLKKAINFRLIQQAFDLRLTSNWKKLISML